MRSKRTAVAVCCVLAVLTACGGHSTKVASQSSSKPRTAAHTHTTAPQSAPGVPKVMMQSGTSYQNATLLRFCQGQSCHQGSGKLPRALAAADPLLFIIDAIPQTANVTLTKAGAATPAETRALHAGSIMVYAPTVSAGTYLVQLNATWPGSTGSWQFTVSIPKS